MAKPNQLAKMQFPEMPSDFQQHYSQLVDTVNTLAGHNGEIELSNHLNLSGNRVKNVAAPASASDALTSGTAEKSYSASTLRSQLEAGSSTPLRSYRQINNGSQREQSSSFLNDLMSTVPNANTITPSAYTSGSQVSVTIPSSPFTFSDGTSVQLSGRTDLLTPPKQYTLTSISVLSGVVTAVFSYTGVAPAIAAGNIATITGVTPTTYNGTVTLTSAVIDTTALTVTVQYQSSTASGAATGGYYQLNGVYYYCAQKSSNSVFLLGPFSGDTQINRLQANFDQMQIVAVVVLTNSGYQATNSGGGGSPITGSPTSGSFF